MITKSEIRQKLHTRKYVFPRYKEPRSVRMQPDGEWYAEQTEIIWFEKIEAYFRLDLERRASSSMLEAYVHKNPPDESVHKHGVAEIRMLTVHLKDSKKKHDVKRSFDTPTVLYRQQEGASRLGVVMRDGVFTPLGKYLLMSRMELWEEYEWDHPEFDPDWSDSDSDPDSDPGEPPTDTSVSFRFLRACKTLAAMRLEMPRTTRSMTKTGYAAPDELTFEDFMQMSVSGTITKASWKRERDQIEPEWKQSQKDYDTFQEYATRNEEWIEHVFGGDTDASDFEEAPSYVELNEQVDDFFADAIAKPTFSRNERQRLAKMFA